MNKIGLKNFGIFKDYQEFDLKPITVLTGPNNSGKSTFSKLFKLLSEGFRTKNNIKEIDVLYFTDKLREQIGDFKSNVSWFSDDDFIEISFSNRSNVGSSLPNFQSEIFLRYSKVTVDTFITSIPDSNQKRIQDKNVEAYLQSIKIIIDGNEVIELKREEEKVPEIEFLNAPETNSITDELFWKCNNRKKYAKVLRDVALKIKNKEIIELKRAKEIHKVNTDFNSKLIWIKADIKEFHKSFSRHKQILLPSLLSEIVLGDNTFFTTHSSTDAYYVELKKGLKKSNINSIEDFINAYRDLEEKYIYKVFNKYFSVFYNNWDEDGGFKWTNIDNLHKILGTKVFKKKNELDKITILEEIENPLTELLIKELAINNTPEYEELLSRYNYSKKISFEYPVISIINNFIKDPYGDILRSLQKLKIKQYQQSEYLHDYYLKSDSTVVQSTIYRFAEYFNKGLIQEETTEFINKWINKLGIGDEIVVKALEIENEIIGYTFLIKKNNRIIPVTANGLGIRKIIKLLLELSINSRSKLLDIKELKNIWNNNGGINGTILLEEPESNLHPAFQSLLVELLVDATHIFAINIIIETHSEYIIRKLQYLTAKKKIIPNASIIYYFHHPDKIPKGEKHIGEKHIKEINIEEDGSLSDDFGPGFFDEATNTKFELLRLKNSQKK